MRRLKLKAKKKQRGGWRPNSGRPVGSVNRMSLKVREKAAETGKLPHEMMLEVARQAVGTEWEGHQITWEDRKWAMQSCSRFYAPVLAAVEQTGKGGGPIQVLSLPPQALKGLSVEELQVLERVFGRLQKGEGRSNGKANGQADPQAYENLIGG